MQSTMVALTSVALVTIAITSSAHRCNNVKVVDVVDVKVSDVAGVKVGDVIADVIGDVIKSGPLCVLNGKIKLLSLITLKTLESI